MKISTIDELKKLNIQDLDILAKDIRQLIVSSVTKNGGHLASNLGTVELTVALHYVFDAPRDKIIFDVGHQTYAHKILTGRADSFQNLRKSNGISGFPKRTESEFDEFDTGHASVALSLATGLLRSKVLNHEQFNIVSILGDGSFLGGQTFEALNDLGTINGGMILILNDNDIAISPRTGALKLHDEVLEKLFSFYNFEYFGSVDGHNLNDLINAFSNLKNTEKKVAIRVVTKKGKGLDCAESCPEKYHAVNSLGIAKSGSFASRLGKKLIDIGKKNDKVVCVTAAMTDGVGLNEFSKCYPNKLFDVGICEAHAVSMAAGLAKGGYKPFVAVYSSFLQRSFDQILNEVCLNDFPVTLLLDHSGLVEGDGETHQGVYDISYLSLMPNMSIAAPSNEDEFEELISWSLNYKHPLAIRYSKTILWNCGEGQQMKIEAGKWADRTPNENIVILTTGAYCYGLALKTAEQLKNKKIKCSVVNALFIKPLDEKLLLNCKDKTVVTIEDNVYEGGFGSAVSMFYSKNNINVKYLAIAVSDPLIKQGSILDISISTGLNPQAVAERIIKFVNNK